MSNRRTAAIVAAGVLLAGVHTPSANAAQVPLPRALVYIADQSEGGRVSVFDATTGQTSPGLGIPDTTFDNDGHNQMAVGDVTGDGQDEVLIANDSGGRIDVLDPATGSPVPGLGIPDTRFNNDDHNQMAVGDVNGDGRDEVLIADASEGGRVHILDARTGAPVPRVAVGDTTFENDGHNQMAVGDVNGDGRDEVLIANDSGGRIDVHDATTNTPAPGLGIPDTRFNNDDHNQLVVGDVDGDYKEEVLIADQSEGGRMHVFDATTGKPAPGLGIGDTTFDNDDHNQVSVGDVNGDGRGEVLVANDSGGRVDVLDATTNAPAPGLGIPDTRFNNDGHNQMVVGQFGKELPDTETQIEPPRPGFYGASIGVAVDERNVYAVHHYRTVANPSTSDQPGTLVVLDRKTMAVRKSIPAGWGARSVAVNPVTDRAYVVNGGFPSYDVSVIDTKTLQVVGTIKLNQVPIDVAVNTKLNRVYVSNPTQGVVHVINGESNAPVEDVNIGRGAQGIFFEEKSETLSVAMTHRDADPATPDVTALVRIVDNGVQRPFTLPQINLGDPGTQPIDVAVDPVNERIMVAALGGGNVTPSVIVLNQRTGNEITRIPIHSPIRAITVNAGSGQAFAVGENGVYMINVAQQKVVRHMEAGTPFAVATSGRQLYVGDFLDGKVRRRAYSSGTPQ